jgi:hypothetical protein
MGPAGHEHYPRCIRRYDQLASGIVAGLAAEWQVEALDVEQGRTTEFAEEPASQVFLGG